MKLNYETWHQSLKLKNWNLTMLELIWAKLSPSLSQILNWNFTFTSRSWKLKFEVEVWSWSLDLKFEVGEEENDKATEKSSYRSVKKGLTWMVTTCDSNEKDENKFWKRQTSEKLVQTSQIRIPMLTNIQQRKMMHAYKIVYLGMKSRILIRELIPIIGFFNERGQWIRFIYNIIRS